MDDRLVGLARFQSKKITFAEFSNTYLLATDADEIKHYAKKMAYQFEVREALSAQPLEVQKYWSLAQNYYRLKGRGLSAKAHTAYEKAIEQFQTLEDSIDRYDMVQLFGAQWLGDSTTWVINDGDDELPHFVDRYFGTTQSDMLLDATMKYFEAIGIIETEKREEQVEHLTAKERLAHLREIQNKGRSKLPK